MTDEALSRRIELERADAARAALELAAIKLESHSTNDLYRKALRLAAKLVRSLKDIVMHEVTQKETDKATRDVQS